VSPADVVALVLATPLIASVELNAWQRFWTGRTETPLPEAGHTILMVIQVAVAASLVLGFMPLRVTFLAAALLYGGLAGGAAFIRMRRGPGLACGCWGPWSTSLGLRLVALDAALALMAGYFSRDYRALPLLGGLVWLISIVGLILLALIVVPDGLYAYRGLRQRNDANNNFRWLRGFPELGTR